MTTTSLNLRIVTPVWAGRPAADMSWADFAACKTGDSSFFPKHGDARARKQREICAGCPVKLACRWHAIVLGEEYGVWGGLSPVQLHRIRAARIRAAKAARKAAATYAADRRAA